MIRFEWRVHATVARTRLVKCDCGPTCTPCNRMSLGPVANINTACVIQLKLPLPRYPQCTGAKWDVVVSVGHVGMQSFETLKDFLL